MKRRTFSASLPLLTACLLAVLLTACSAIKRGKVVRKGIDRVGTRMHPGPIHWVDLRGENQRGEVVTARVEFFEIDWRNIRKNEWITPDSYGAPRFFQRIHAYREAQRAESGRFGATEKPARQPKPRTTRRTAAKPASVEAASDLGTVQPPSADARTARLREVREQALEDPSVRELKTSIKSARSDEEQQRAWREYRATLRDKMHAIDPSLGDLIDQNEAAAPTR